MPIAGLMPVASNMGPNFKNITKIFTMTDRENLKVVRVLNGTANITNGHVLVRRKVEAADGVYDVGIDGQLVVTRYDYGLRYPDIELVRPPFESMQPLCELPNEIFGRLIQFCQEVRRVEGDVVIEKNGAFMLQNPTLNVPFPFGIPESTKVDPKYFEIAILEMLQYPSIYLLQEKTPLDEGTAPLVFGRNWGSCVLLMPIKDR